MARMKEYYYDVLTAESADNEAEFDEMANNLENIEDAGEFWEELEKVEEFYYEKVA